MQSQIYTMLQSLWSPRAGDVCVQGPSHHFERHREEKHAVKVNYTYASTGYHAEAHQ